MFWSLMMIKVRITLIWGLLSMPLFYMMSIGCKWLFTAATQSENKKTLKSKCEMDLLT